MKRTLLIGGALLVLFNPYYVGAQQAEDASAELACSHFRNVIRDAADGVLTDAEFRTKIQEVDKSASVSKIAAVRDSSRAVLAAVTTGTAEEVTNAAAAMLDACDKYFADVKKAEESQTTEAKQSGEKKDSDCFIATAAYGTATAEDIDILRDFRDEVLLSNLPGQELVAWYYAYGPAAADFISENRFLRAYVREAYIRPLVKLLEITQPIWQ